MQKEEINPENAYQMFLIIWFALLISQLMFLFIVFFIKPEMLAFDFSKPFLGENATVILAFAAISISVLAVSLVMKSKYLAQSVAEQKIEHVQTAMIVGSALAESVSLFGLLLAFSFDYQYFFLFSALGIFGTLLHFPKRANVHAASCKI